MNVNRKIGKHGKIRGAHAFPFFPAFRFQPQ
jgi:hypothetical protein